MMRFLLPAICLSFAVYQPRTAAGDSTLPAVEPDLGAHLYLKRCQQCHTMGAKSTGKLDLADMSDEPEAEVRDQIRKMQEYSGPLNDQQVDALLELLMDSHAKQRLEAEQRLPSVPKAQQDPGIPPEVQKANEARAKADQLSKKSAAQPPPSGGSNVTTSSAETTSGAALTLPPAARALTPAPASGSSLPRAAGEVESTPRTEPPRP